MLVGSVDGEPGKSFSINLQTGVFGDFADGEKMKRGAIALWMTARKVDFPIAVRELTEWLGTSPTHSPPQTAGQLNRPTPKSPYQLTNKDIGRMTVAAHRLAQRPELIVEVFGDRPEWNLGVIRNLALEGDLGLEPDCWLHPFQGPAVLFGYRHGIKARWPEKQIRWLCGAAHGELWRQSLLLKTTCQVLVCEGEPDAVTAVRFGLEDNDTLVTALSGAAVMPASQPFAGRHVVFIPDTDAAGQAAIEKLNKLFSSVAQSFAILELPAESKDLSEWARTRLDEHIRQWSGAFGPRVQTPDHRVRAELINLGGRELWSNSKTSSP